MCGVLSHPLCVLLLLLHGVLLKLRVRLGISVHVLAWHCTLFGKLFFASKMIQTNTVWHVGLREIPS